MAKNDTIKRAEYYLGNPNLPTGSANFEYSVEELKEMKLCAKDISHFAEKYFYITTLDKGKVPIELYAPQKRVLKSLEKNRFVVVLSSRQSGKTTVMTIYSLWTACFQSDKSIMIIANKEDTAITILRRIRMAYEQLPNWLKPGVKQWGKTEVIFSNDSRIVISTTTSTAARGETINVLIVDEMAFIPPHLLDPFWKSVIPIVSSSRNTKIFVVSCVTKETYVFTPSGIKQVSDFIDLNKNGAYQIPEYSVLGNNETNTGKIMFNNGPAETRIIQTSNTQLECSLEHKLWSCKNGQYGWHKAGELSCGDYIALQYGQEMWGNNDDVSDFTPTISPKIKNKFNITKITPDIAYFFGLYISEGSAYRIFKNEKLVSGSITISCGDDINEHLEFLNMHISKSNKCKVYNRLSSRNLIEFMEYLGFDLTLHAPQKVIPKRLLSMSRTNMIALLQGIFDGDGFCSKDIGRVGISLSSKELIEQIRIILNNFGILTYYTEIVTPPNKMIKVASQGYRLECSGRYSQVFLEKIGFRLKRKQAQIELYKDRESRNTKDVIPACKQVVKNGLCRGGIANILKLGISAAKFYTDITENVSRDVMLKIKNKLDYKYITPDFFAFLNEYVRPDIKWDSVVNITPSNNTIYDFSLNEVEGDKWCHSVIYNGMVGHQTPNGTGNKFHQIYTAAENGQSKEWHHERIDWWEIPNHGRLWKREMIEALGSIEAFNQEFGNEFIETGESAIDVDVISLLRANSRSPMFTQGEGHYKVWEEPKADHLYSVGVDVSEGVGEAASVVQVVDITDLTNIRQVACYHNSHVEPYHFAKIIFDIAHQWGRPYLMIERNNCGGQVIDALVNTHHYENIVSYTPEKQKQARLGVYAHMQSKYKGVSNMRYWMNSLHAFKAYDINLVQELETFVRHPNGTWKKKDGRGNRDDRVMALVWALFILETEICERYFDVIEQDDRGKPLKIGSIEITPPKYYRLDPQYRDPNSPMPIFFSMEPNAVDRDDTKEQLLEKGWTPVEF